MNEEQIASFHINISYNSLQYLLAWSLLIFALWSSDFFTTYDENLYVDQKYWTKRFKEKPNACYRNRKYQTNVKFESLALLDST